MHHFQGMIILSRSWIMSVFAKEIFELKFATALHLSSSLILKIASTIWYLKASSVNSL